MHRTTYSESDVPPPVAPEPTPPPSTEPFAETETKSRKKLYLLIGAIAIAAIVIAIVLVPILSVPQGYGQTIPYSLNYNVGENLTYSASATISANGQNVVETGTAGMDVVAFDGYNYTINGSVQLQAEGITYNSNATVIVNKMGQTVYSSFGEDFQNPYSAISGSPEFAAFFNRASIQVGQTYSFPINFSNATESITGTENLKIADIENITVQAGTYKTFKMELSANNVQATINGEAVSVSCNGFAHIDYNTCHCIDFSLQENANAEGETMKLSMYMALTSDINPVS